MPYIPNEALTREQGEQIIDVLKGEEPKEYGYPYTNEVLNKEQGDRIIKAFKTFKDGIPTEGLPDPSELPDGTAMVVVNGEWKMQDGYGWIEEGNFTAITWDGNTEGRDAIYVELEGQRFETHYKVSDLIFTKDSVLGGKVTMNGVDHVIRDVVNNESDDYSSSTAQFTAVLVDTFAVISCNAPGIIRATDLGPTLEYHCLTTGIYFMSFVSQGIDSYVSSLTYGTPSISHPIGHTLMPEGYGYYGDPAFEPITWDGETEGRVAVTTDDEIPVMYKVSDAIIQSGDFIGAIEELSYGSHVVEEEYLEIFDDATIAEFVFSGKAGEYTSESLGVSLFVPEDGTYFYNSDGTFVSALTAPASVHQFDPALIPSSGWPVDLPKPSAGGYGYTEQIEQTVITWDGDTEGREILMPDFPCYKVSDNGVPASFLIGATIVFDGNEVTVTQDMINDMIDGVASVNEVVISVVDAVEFEGITINKGVYFIKTGQGKYVSSLTYGGDIVHKIAQKYIPNTMVKVGFDNTFDEILEILNSGSMPYIDLSRVWPDARLYVSSVGQERICFGSPAIKNPSTISIEHYSVYVDKDGWGEVEHSNSFEVSTVPLNDGRYFLICDRMNGNNFFHWGESVT